MKPKTLVSIQNQELKKKKNYGSNNDLLSLVSSALLRTVGGLRMGAAVAVGDD
jgi:hypothetical protein